MREKSLKIILTGATGFVGEGILLACLNHPAIEEVLVVNRKHLDRQHPKLRELIVPDFFRLEAMEAQLAGYDACFYCAGISAVGLKEAEYTRITYDTTLHFAQALLALNPDMAFNFVSGSHTDGSEKGRVMWARVKGKTENALLRLPFRRAFNFRPGAMIPFAGQKHVKPFYQFIVRLIAFLLPKSACTLEEMALAMIHAVLTGYPKPVLEIADIKALAYGVVVRL